MAETLKTDITTAPSSVGSILTNAASKFNEVLCIHFHNTNTTAEILELHFVPNNSGAVGTAAATNRVLRVTLMADETFEYAPKAPDILGATNDSIQAKATTASKVVCKISRIETDV